MKTADQRKGKKPKDRTLVKQPAKGKRLQANQWTNTVQQNQFMEYWLTPSSETFANAYKSALKAGYSPYYATRITAGAVGNKWLEVYVRRASMSEEHVMQGLVDLYSNPKSYNNSRSPADTRVKVLELLAKITGILDGDKHTTNIIVQPILGGASTGERKIVEVKPTPNTAP
jgi:hypothetical protein